MLSGRGAVESFRLDVGEGQELVDAAHGMSRDDLGEQVGQIGVGIDVEQLAGGNERGDDGPVLAATVGSCKQVVLPGIRTAVSSSSIRVPSSLGTISLRPL